MFQFFCYSIYVHVKIINVNWNCWDHASSPKVLRKKTASAEAACT
jgi:hypothetical protein